MKLFCITIICAIGGYANNVRFCFNMLFIWYFRFLQSFHFSMLEKKSNKIIKFKKIT